MQRVTAGMAKLDAYLFVLQFAVAVTCTCYVLIMT